MRVATMKAIERNLKLKIKRGEDKVAWSKGLSFILKHKDFVPTQVLFCSPVFKNDINL